MHSCTLSFAHLTDTSSAKSLMQTPDTPTLHRLESVCSVRVSGVYIRDGAEEVSVRYAGRGAEGALIALRDHAELYPLRLAL